MAFFVYIIENAAGKLYIGHTDHLDRRLDQHNSPDGKTHLGKYTHKHGPWKLVWSEPHPSRSSACQREKEIKNWKSAQRIRKELFSQS